MGRMTARREIVVATLAVAILLAGCASSASPTPVPTPTPLPPGFVSIPTLSGRLPAGETELACAGVGLADAFLRGDPSAYQKVWVEPIGPGLGGARVVIWPAGFRARFAPGLELIDSSGVVVARAGDRLTNVGGEITSTGVREIWEFSGHHYGCY